MIFRTLRSLHLYRNLSFFFFLIFLAVSSSAAAEGISVVSQQGQDLYFYNDYHALIVGVSNYDTWPDMPHAVEDATDISRFLKQMGFKVRLVIDPTSLELKKALKDLVHKTGQKKERGILFYYAGHGETRTEADGTKTGWLIPRDCPKPGEDNQGFIMKAVSMEDIETYSMQTLSRHMIMLFDASLPGDIFSLEAPVLRAITESSILPVRQYIFAGREGEAVQEKSMFKHFLLKGLRGDADFIHDGYITGSELALYLEDIIAKNPIDKRHPLFAKYNHMALARGDFVFHLTEAKSSTGRLFVKTKPEGAEIKVLNIRPRFSQGIELLSGKYHLEVSRAGYQATRKWITLQAGEDRTIDISLEKLGDTLKNSLGMQFVSIRSGSFRIGSPDSEHNGFHDEQRHSVTLTKRYYIQNTEVTVGQFRQFVKATGYKTNSESSGGCWVNRKGGGWKKKKGSSWKNPGSSGDDSPGQIEKLPVTCISWNDARAFIKWISKKEGMTYGLPAEAEWEFACRAGTSTPFSSGKCLSTKHANYGGLDPLFSECKDSYSEVRKKPVQVASLTPNPWGLFNMHGNVSEWSADWYGPYPSTPVTDPKGPSSGTARVIRGGHWLAKAYGSRSAKRSSFPPDFASDVVGFRLVMRP